MLIYRRIDDDFLETQPCSARFELGVRGLMEVYGPAAGWRMPMPRAPAWPTTS